MGVNTKTLDQPVALFVIIFVNLRILLQK